MAGCSRLQGDSGPLLPTLLPDTLPRLRNLQAHLNAQSSLILFGPLSSGKYRPLEWIWLDGRSSVFEDICGHLSNIATLSAIVTSYLNLDLDQVSDAEKFDWLCTAATNVHTLSYNAVLYERGFQEYVLRTISRHCEGLVRLPHLTSLKEFFSDSWTTDSCLALLTMLSMNCPNLSCVDKWVLSSAGVWEIDEAISRYIEWPQIDDNIPRNFFYVL